MIALARRLAWGLGGICALYLMLGVGLRFFEGRLLFYPPETQWQDCALPAGVRPVEFGAERGLLTDAGHDAVLVFYHGNAGSACDWRYLGPNHMVPLGYDVLVVEYPGYGGDVRGLEPSAHAIRVAVRAADAWARAQYDRVAVMGFSIGTGPASAHAALGDVEAALLIAPYQRLHDLMWSKGYLYPRWWAVNRFDNAAALTDAEAPVAILYCGEDRVIPPKHSLALAAHLRGEGVTVTTTEVGDAGHNGMFTGPAFDRFLADALKGQ